jgi:hypothetical protein
MPEAGAGPDPDRLTIRDLIENWAIWRDGLMWDRFRTVWHQDGRMMATWFQGTADEFIQVSREGYERGVRILHFLGGSSIDVEGSRAIAQTKMTISQRAPVEGVPCSNSTKACWRSSRRAIATSPISRRRSATT